ncbi:flippase-like domain-containing protein [Candidatus Saccharibacteria bacterium]|nr:flippase-like domain-containing protein [Candidatus Saccharibacteria bacterium]
MRPSFLKFSFKNFLSFVTFGIVVFIIYRNWGDIMTALDHIRETNLFILLLLIPEQLMMLYCGGRIFFSYHDSKRDNSFKDPPKTTQIRISLESNFARQAYPSAGISSAAFLSWRLKPYGFSSAQTSFIYILRYFAIVCTNQIQTLLAVLVIALTIDLTPAGQTILLLAGFIALLTGLFLAGTIFLIADKKRILWFATKGTTFINFAVKKATFGHRKQVISQKIVEQFLDELHETYKTARKSPKIIKQPILWGMLYSFFEIATYWVVAISLGHAELFPQIMIGEAVGSVAGAIIPYGLYELGMAGAMASLGVDLGLASLIVVITRVFVLAESLIPGYVVYQNTLNKTKKLGKPVFVPPEEEKK